MAGSSAAIAKKRIAERDRVFPDAATRVWSRKEAKGFTTVPRSMPLLCAIMDAHSKGNPLGAVYLDLWFKAFDEMYLIVESPQERAYFAGFGGQRAVTTWTVRMRKLIALGFIEAQSGTRGEFHHVLLVNPDLVVAKLEMAARANKRTEPALLALLDAYHQRQREVGAE